MTKQMAKGQSHAEDSPRHSMICVLIAERFSRIRRLVSKTSGIFN